MNPRHTTDHDPQRNVRHAAAPRPTDGPGRDERSGRDDAGALAPDSSGTSAGDDAYGCVEWFDFDVLANGSRPHGHPRRR